MKQLFPLVLVAVTAVVAVAASAGNDDNAQVLSQISGYRQWTAVNGEPVKVEVPTGLSLREVPL